MGSIRDLRYVIPMASFFVPNELSLAPAVREVLESFSRRHHTPQKLAERARLVLEFACGGTNPEVARRTGMHPTSVRHWRRRWHENEASLVDLEGDPKALAKAVVAVLEDQPRSGTPPTFTPEQVAAIVALACEPPERSGIPASQWSCVLLAEEAVRRGIVASIAPQSVWRFLKSGRPQAAQGSPLAHQAQRGSGRVRGARLGP
jgi:transposase-like protein